MLICVFVFSCTHLSIINIHHTVIRLSQHTLNPDVHAEMEEVLRSFYCDLSTVKVEILQSEITKLQVKVLYSNATLVEVRQNLIIKEGLETGSCW